MLGHEAIEAAIRPYVDAGALAGAAILVWRGDQDQVPAAARRLGIGVVKSVNECLDILAQVDLSDRQRPGILERVMRALGIKEPINQA